MFSIGSPCQGYGMVFDWLGFAIAVLSLIQVLWSALVRS